MVKIVNKKLMTDFLRITEQESNYRHLDKMTPLEILTHINVEDSKVAAAVQHTVAAFGALRAITRQQEERAWHAPAKRRALLRVGGAHDGAGRQGGLHVFLKFFFASLPKKKKE